ncbi:MAG: stress response protein, partial [Acidimicrobiia bacterium]|nr:stress response protein [Acidimicrobiia bacterium]
MAKAESDPQEKWHRARLIPTSGISGDDEQERRATSALLAVMTAVREFGHSIIGPLGAPKGPVIETFTEVRFELDGQIVIPDGLIRVTRGKKVWVCLVEVKTGSAALEVEQVHSYLDVARENGFDCVLTISNALRAVDGAHPLTGIDNRKLRKVDLYHLSWAAILTSAIYQRVHYGVSDPDQAWILSELIRYLEHPRSGAQEFEDMGSSWVEVREAVSNKTLRAKDPATLDVCQHWGHLIRFNCMKLTRRLGVEVVGGELSKRPKPQLDLAKVAEVLSTTGRLESSYAIANTAGPIDLVADL